MKSILVEKENRSRAKARRIALIGYRATGKTTVGIKLADLLEWNFTDIDEEIVKEQGKNIEKIVSEKGWPHFRKLESLKLKELINREKLVVATGGGAILDKKNRELLKENFFVIWLTASTATIKRRLKKDISKFEQRPSLSGKGLLDEVDEILEMRTGYYKETSDIIIATDKYSPQEVIDYIMCELKKEGKDD